MKGIPMDKIDISVGNIENLTINKKRISLALRTVERVVKGEVKALLRQKKGTPSAPGQAPAMETGRLVRSIKTRITNNKRSIGIRFIADVPYGVALSAGANGPNGRHMDARPFLSTVLDQRRGWIIQTITQAIEFQEGNV